MKIKTNTFTHTEKVHGISFIIFDKELIPHSIDLEIEYDSDLDVPTMINGISLSDWFISMLDKKFIAHSLLRIPENLESYIGDNILYVDNLSIPYIIKTMLLILERLLPNITINYLNYE